RPLISGKFTLKATGDDLRRHCRNWRYIGVLLVGTAAIARVRDGGTPRRKASGVRCSSLPFGKKLRISRQSVRHMGRCPAFVSQNSDRSAGRHGWNERG